MIKVQEKYFSYFMAFYRRGGNLKLNRLIIFSSVLIVFCFISGVYASVRKEQILFSGQYLDVPWMGYRYSGPYWVQSDRTIRVEWVADRSVTVYILNQKDYEQWPKIGGPLMYRIYKTARQGILEYHVNYADNFYIVVMGYAGVAARIYNWTEKIVWFENNISESTRPLFTVALIILTIAIILILAIVIFQLKQKSKTQLNRNPNIPLTSRNKNKILGK